MYQSETVRKPAVWYAVMQMTAAQDNRRDYCARTLLHHHWGTCAVRPLIAYLPHALIPFQRIVDFMPRRCPFLVIQASTSC